MSELGMHEVRTAPASADTPATTPATEAAAREIGTPMTYLDHVRAEVAAISTETPAGRAYFAPYQAMAVARAEARPPEAGVYTIEIEGSPDLVSVGYHSFSADEFAALIREDPAYEGQPIRLISSETGSTPDGFAAQLAAALNQDVIAPTAVLWTDPDGSLVVASIDQRPGGRTDPPDGHWVVFHPPTSAAD